MITLCNLGLRASGTSIRNHSQYQKKSFIFASHTIIPSIHTIHFIITVFVAVAQAWSAPLLNIKPILTILILHLISIFFKNKKKVSRLENQDGCTRYQWWLTSLALAAAGYSSGPSWGSPNGALGFRFGTILSDGNHFIAYCEWLGLHFASKPLHFVPKGAGLYRSLYVHIHRGDDAGFLTQRGVPGNTAAYVKRNGVIEFCPLLIDKNLLINDWGFDIGGVDEGQRLRGWPARRQRSKAFRMICSH